MASVITCSHVPPAPHPDPRTPRGCEECLQSGMQWVHLRLCLSCGHVGCCDNSPGKHATKHARRTEHPVIQSYEPGEDWGWCYIESRELGPFPPVRRA